MFTRAVYQRLASPKLNSVTHTLTRTLTHTLILTCALSTGAPLVLGLLSSDVATAWAQEEEFPIGGEPTIDDSQCEAPDVLLLLDRSGSMLDDMKWEQATAAVQSTFSSYFDKLRFGLLPFPNEGSCGVMESQLAIEIGAAAAADLPSIFEASSPVDIALTPLADSINAGRRALDAARQPDRRGFLILLTDGIETCAPEAIEDSAPIEAARLAADAGYQVYVIGFGSLVRRNILREMALAGGTGGELLVSDQATLESTLNQIIASATTEICDRLDNDCDGRIDEGVDCEPTCYPEIQDCPCNNNAECGRGEECIEGLCAPIPCDTICDQGYICRAEECIPFEPVNMGGSAGERADSTPPSFGGMMSSAPNATAGSTVPSSFGGMSASTSGESAATEESSGCDTSSTRLSVIALLCALMLTLGYKLRLALKLERALPNS